MKKGKLIKWLLVLVISAVLFIIGSTCAKAEGVGAEPTPTAAATVDPWSGDFEFPDWMQTEFDFTTPSPVTPEPFSGLRAISDVDLSGMSPINTSQLDQSSCAWSSFMVNGDSSVWYFKSHTNTQIAVGSNSSYRLYYPWNDSIPGYIPSYSSTNALNFYSTGMQLVTLSSSNSMVDASYGGLNFSFFSHDFGGYRSGIEGDRRIVYYIAMNKLYPKFYNPPSWFSEAGITEDLIYDALVYPVCYVKNVDGFEYSISLDPVTLRELYSGILFDIDLYNLFHSSSKITNINIQISIPFNDWSGLELYHNYLSNHPEITGHIPFYIYWDGSYAEQSSGKGSFTLVRLYGYTQKADDRNWLQKLFTPSQAQLNELFQYYAPSVDGDGVFSFAATFRSAMFSWLVDTTQTDFKITLPEMTVPINGTRYTFSNEYEYNLTGSLRDAGILPYIRMATNMMITVLFVNSVITMTFAVFDIHLFDGVKE